MRCKRLRGRPGGVLSRVQWTTRRRTRSRRMINNENTAKQTAAARGTAGPARRGSGIQSAQRRRPYRPRVLPPRPTHYKIDARSATGILRQIILCNLDGNPTRPKSRPPSTLVIVMHHLCLQNKTTHQEFCADRVSIKIIVRNYRFRRIGFLNLVIHANPKEHRAKRDVATLA